MTPIALLKWLDRQVNEGTSAGLWTVVDHEGSSPGRRGFMMAVTPRGFAGTVGGGVMESTLLREGRALLSRAGAMGQRSDAACDTVLRTLIHRRDAPVEAQSGLFCAGSQTQVFCPIGPRERRFLEEALAGMTRSDVVSMDIDSDGLRFSVHADDTPLERPQFSHADGGFRYRAFISPRHTVYVFGAGHVGRALCLALAPLDFRVVSLDDRDEHPLGDCFPVGAAEHIVSPYACVRDHVRASSRAYAVVVTAHRDSDVTVLREVIDLPFAYLGVMGSAAKVQAIRRALLASGVDEGLVRKLRAPIGLPIGSESPAEIAVSVAAELIGTRRGVL